MPIGPQGQRRPADVVGCAVHVARIATGEIEDTREKPRSEQPAKVRIGKARAAALMPEERSNIAMTAASAKLGKKK